MLPAASEMPCPFCTPAFKRTDIFSPLCDLFLQGSCAHPVCLFLHQLFSQSRRTPASLETRTFCISFKGVLESNPSCLRSYSPSFEGSKRISPLNIFQIHQILLSDRYLSPPQASQLPRPRKVASFLWFAPSCDRFQMHLFGFSI